MRHALCGFIHFSKYMIEQRGVKYVPMLLSNSSSLESRFSRQRRTNHDSATKYSAGVSNMTTRSARAQTTGRCYLAEDCAEENGTGRSSELPNGFSLAKSQRLATEAALQRITASRKSINEQRQRPDSTSLFATKEPPTKHSEMKELAQKFNYQIDKSVIDAIIGTKRFQQFQIFATTTRAQRNGSRNLSLAHTTHWSLSSTVSHPIFCPISKMKSTVRNRLLAWGYLYASTSFLILSITMLCTVGCIASRLNHGDRRYCRTLSCEDLFCHKRYESGG